MLLPEGILLPSGRNGLGEEGTAGGGSAAIGQGTIYRCLRVSAGSTGEEEQGGLGVLDEGRGAEGDSGEAELHVLHQSSCVPGGSPASTHGEQPWPAAP